MKPVNDGIGAPVGAGAATACFSPDLRKISHADAVIQEKILLILSVYPRISHTMLQMGLGPTLQAAIWRPLLDDLIQRKLVMIYDVYPSSDEFQRYQTRTRSFPVISLRRNTPQNIIDRIDGVSNSEVTSQTVDGIEIPVAPSEVLKV